MWLQRQFYLPAKPRGLHLITQEILGQLPEIRSCRVGLLHLFVRHTSAALTLNENADPTVRTDLNRWLDHAVAEDTRYFQHTCEGPDDMPAHVKSSLLGASVSIPVTDGKLALGTWQGIYLCEFRDAASARQLVATLQGE